MTESRKSQPHSNENGKLIEKVAASIFGVIFIVVMLIIAIIIPEPKQFPYMVFRTVLALAAGGVAAMIPGIIRIHLKIGIRAVGAISVFIIVFFFNPASLAIKEIKPPEPPNNEIVYITKFGSRYHREICGYLKFSKIPISLKEACANGYTPCLVCNPPPCPENDEIMTKQVLRTSNSDFMNDLENKKKEAFNYR